MLPVATHSVDFVRIVDAVVVCRSFEHQTVDGPGDSDGFDDSGDSEVPDRLDRSDLVAAGVDDSVAMTVPF